MTTTSPIGVFDSGVGGLSVLRHLLHIMPHERYIYLGDTARVPYGNKSRETVELYSRQCAEFLIGHQVKQIVIACNSASSLALRAVESVSNVPVVDVIQPSASAAFNQSLNGRIGVIGTRATIGSNAYAESIRRIAQSKVEVIQQACPLFVPFAEEGWIAHPATRAIAEEYMKPLIAACVDVVVLGCTHYPLLADTIHEAIPQATLIDPGKHAALRSQQILSESSMLAPPHDTPVTRIEFYVTDIPATFSQVAKQFLGFDVPEPVLVHIE